MQNDFVFTSESITEGHPDKLCDQISDAIVDRFLQQDPRARVIAECAASTAILFVAARFDARASVDFPAVARQVIDQVGYDQPAFNGKTCSIVTSLKECRPMAIGVLMSNTSRRRRSTASRSKIKSTCLALRAIRLQP